MADLEQTGQTIREQNVAQVSLQESLDATTATGRLMMNLLAKCEPMGTRSHTRERTKDAMAELKAAAKVTGDPELMIPI